MKIGPFVSYIKWLGELGSVGCVFMACSVPFVRLIPRGHFFQNGTLHISRSLVPRPFRPGYEAIFPVEFEFFSSSSSMLYCCL